MKLTETTEIYPAKLSNVYTSFTRIASLVQFSFETRDEFRVYKTADNSTAKEPDFAKGVRSKTVKPRLQICGRTLNQEIYQ